jgi:hypothetical protein
VIFTVDGVAQAPVNLDHKGHAVLHLQGLGVGLHTITAQYSGDTQFGGSSSSLSPQVAAGGTTATVHSSQPSSAHGTAVTFTASVVPVAPAVGMPTGMIEFDIDGTAFQTEQLDNTGHATLMVMTLTKGSHKITVKYLGDGNFKGSSSKLITQTVR